MKRFVSRLLSLMLVASMFLTGCSLLSPETLLSGDYQQDTIYVIDNLSSAITLPDDDPNKADNQADAGALISEYVSRYRRKPQLAGSASFMTMATALNGLAGHYNSYPNRPLPQKLKDRLEQEFKQAKIALKRESAA
ncbi:photosystem II protein Psb27 [Acaryochloris sp. 'Moss Beach']|uniref:photosystem II protein Psb27 n=1 Tax=Acaryochloris TaxID=155977 RepID=UPI001BAEED81|nr:MULTISPECIES: photosystem II protein Psb27 [Acaryochloris]QUY43526.1 photosystem II protein Psb27 [Acaryochloris marina S15]UJB68336.1 photosystem II protein Psb27 [Acaryochloris sp. 'Moss Beach']